MLTSDWGCCVEGRSIREKIPRSSNLGGKVKPSHRRRQKRQARSRQAEADWNMREISIDAGSEKKELLCLEQGGSQAS
jgi:hypothetical protein